MPKLSKLEVDRKCIISASGFTSRAREEATLCGVELPTLAEVGLPDWWLISSVEVHSNAIELIYFRLNYKQEEDAKIITKLQGVDAGDFFVVTPTESFSVNDFLSHHGIETSKRPDFDVQVKDQEKFEVKIAMATNIGVLRYPGGDVPLPSSILAVFRLHRSYKSVPLTAYQMKNIDAFTYTPDLRGLEGKQFTFVAEPQNDGSRRLALSIADVAPRPTQITHAEEATQRLKSRRTVKANSK